MANSMETPQKIKNKAAICFSNSTSWHLSKKITLIEKIYVTPMFIAALLVTD